MIFFMGPHFANAQQSRAQVKFKDGKVLEGFGKLSSKNTLKFRKSKDDKALKYSFDDIEYASIYSFGERTKYVQYLSKTENTPLLLEEHIIGAISLYSISAGGNIPGADGGSSYNSRIFFVRKSEFSTVEYLCTSTDSGKKFRKNLLEYFKNCPALINKIQQKESGFGKYDVENIINYFNANCTID